MTLSFDTDIVLAKADIVRRCVRAIRSVRAGDYGNLPDWIVSDLTVLNLQRAIEAIIDLANHLIAENELPLPRSAAHAFRLLTDASIIPPLMAATATKMVGFRNIAVHQYAEIDPAILARLADRELSSIEDLLDRFLAVTLREA